jgi:hypothetical protein
LPGTRQASSPRRRSCLLPRATSTNPPPRRRLVANSWNEDWGDGGALGPAGIWTRAALQCCCLAAVVASIIWRALPRHACERARPRSDGYDNGRHLQDLARPKPLRHRVRRGRWRRQHQAHLVGARRGAGLLEARRAPCWLRGAGGCSRRHSDRIAPTRRRRHVPVLPGPSPACLLHALILTAQTRVAGVRAAPSSALLELAATPRRALPCPGPTDPLLSPAQCCSDVVGGLPIRKNSCILYYGGCNEARIGQCWQDLTVGKGVCLRLLVALAGVKFWIQIALRAAALCLCYLGTRLFTFLP